MTQFVTDRFDDSYPEDEPLNLGTWSCSRCGGKFIDPEDNPTGDIVYPYERKDYWLGVTEPICSACAIKSGIPSIDEEYDADV